MENINMFIIGLIIGVEIGLIIWFTNIIIYYILKYKKGG
jgi:hypothetical protein